VSKLTTARVLFRDEILEKIDVGRHPSSKTYPDLLVKSMSLQYEEAVDAVGKTLHVFARRQQ